MEIGTYTRNILIEKQSDGRYAILLESNVFDASMGTSYVLLGFAQPKTLVQVDGHQVSALSIAKAQVIG